MIHILRPCTSKGCLLCKNYLVKTTLANSFHISSRFKIKGTLDCDSKDIVHIFNDKVCNLSSIGCTADILKVGLVTMRVILNRVNIHVKFPSIFLRILVNIS